MINEDMKKYTREKYIKALLRCYFTATRLLKLKSLTMLLKNDGME